MDGKLIFIAVLILLCGGAFILYVGASFRQIDVNSNRISEIELHGTAILQKLQLQVSHLDDAVSEMKRERPENVQALQRQVASLELALKACKPAENK